MVTIVSARYQNNRDRDIVPRVPASKRAVTARRAPTHDRLVAAATRVVARHGFHAATVGEIAREAGFSVGAIYSNFGGKDDLFLAVFDGHLRWFEERLEAAAGAAQAGRAFSEEMDALSRDPEQLLVFIEFWAYAVRKPKLRRTFARRMAGIRASVAEAIERRGTAQLPPDTTALILLALVRGLGMEKLADPDAVDASAAELIDRLVP